MLPNRENVLRVLARLEKAGALPQDGPTSVFISGRAGLVRTHATQVAVRVQGELVYARISRLPFVRPMVFTRRALREVQL